ncbi:hypothetical protein RND81_07G032000 [Saponaria officinalis]|uniref:Uncharacterized protein n=1 Tax=Saponaria officinalis TaxID=3572 RepID=A0AAW1JLB4_SAPOF
MWVAGGKKKSSSAMIMMLIMIILLTKVGAARPFPLRKGQRLILSMEISDNHLKKHDDLFSKYFNVTSLPHFNTTVVYDVKRIVPSCPDPLHN